METLWVLAETVCWARTQSFWFRRSAQDFAFLICSQPLLLPLLVREPHIESHCDVSFLMDKRGWLPAGWLRTPLARTGSPLMCILSCILKGLLWPNGFSHLLHLWGSLPVCVLRCEVRVDLQWQIFHIPCIPDVSHLWALSRAARPDPMIQDSPHCIHRVPPCVFPHTQWQLCYAWIILHVIYTHRVSHLREFSYDVLWGFLSEQTIPHIRYIFHTWHGIFHTSHITYIFPRVYSLMHNKWWLVGVGFPTHLTCMLSLSCMSSLM